MPSGTTCEGGRRLSPNFSFHGKVLHEREEKITHKSQNRLREQDIPVTSLGIILGAVLGEADVAAIEIAADIVEGLADALALAALVVRLAEERQL